MQQATRWIFTGALLFVASPVFTTSTDAQTVKVNWQQSAPFSDYHTYAWKDSKNEGSDFYKQWVHKDVDEEMTKKGFQKVDPSQNPDLLLTYHIVTQEVLDSTTTDDGFGWGGGPWGFWGGWGEAAPGISETETHPRLMGMLALDMGDAKKKELVWRGQATVDAISNTQRGDEKQTQSSVKKMFDKFPPKEKG